MKKLKFEIWKTLCSTLSNEEKLDKIIELVGNQDNNHDPNCFHECSDCNNRCNCNDSECSCCKDEEKTK